MPDTIPTKDLGYFKIEIDWKDFYYWVVKWPNLDRFLEELSKIANIYVQTAALKEYALKIISIIDKDDLYKLKSWLYSTNQF